MYARTMTTRSCPLCGLSVFFHNGSDYAPVNIPGMIIGNLAEYKQTTETQVFAYIPHVCDPGDLEAHDRTRAQIREALEELAESIPEPAADDDAPQQRHQLLAQRLHKTINQQRAVQLELNDFIYQQGLTHYCPKCEAQIGDPCENLNSRRRGVIELTKNPHPDRLPRVDYAEIDPTTELESDLKRTTNHRNELISEIESIQDLIRKDRDSHTIDNMRQMVLDLAKKLG